MTWVYDCQQNSWEKGERLSGCDPKRINWRWFVRVFCWRFLEISSRIIMFSLIWQNLGGMAVFIILSCEMLYVIYLSILCETLSFLIFHFEEILKALIAYTVLV